MWREYVRQVKPYTPGEQPRENNVIKLNKEFNRKYLEDITR